MKRAIAALITVVILCAIVSIALREPSADEAPASGPTPEQCIQRMFEAAERGDVVAYLDCFTGQEREQLDRQLLDQSPETLAKTLMEAIDQLKGHAVHQAQISGDTALVTVETCLLQSQRKTAIRVDVGRIHLAHIKRASRRTIST